MSNQLPAVARNVHMNCKKCGVDRYHVVVAHVDSRTAKVKCEVCGSQKTYKLPSEAKPRSSLTVRRKTATRKTADGARSHSQSWRDLSDTIGTQSARNYNIRESFAAHTAITHPKFGVGFVTASHPDKIDVVFEDSMRSLVHNRG